MWPSPPSRSLAQSEFFSRPRFSHLLKPEDCLATPCDVITLDMLTLHVTDLEKLRGQFTFIVEKAGTFHGFTSWFRVQFQSLERDKTTLELLWANPLEADSVHAGRADLAARWRDGVWNHPSTPEPRLETSHDCYHPMEHQQHRGNRKLHGKYPLSFSGES